MYLMEELSGFQRDLLYVIAGLDEPKGLAIKDELEEHYETRVDRGRLYPNLNSLADMGLVEKQRVDERTNSYVLTAKGRSKLEAHHQWKAENTPPEL